MPNAYRQFLRLVAKDIDICKDGLPYAYLLYIKVIEC